MSHILLVEDDEFVRDMLTQVLERASHTVISAADGEEAIEILRRFKPEVMITDIVMPKKDGTALIAEVAEKHPQLKIIAISGGGRLGPEGYLDLSEALGAHASFKKPIDKEALLMAVDLLLMENEKQ